MKIIPIVKRIIQEEKLDPTFKIEFNVQKYPELNEIPPEVHKNIVVSMHHYETIEMEYKDWEAKYKRKISSDVEYPDVLTTPPKDDVVEYSPESW